MGIKQKGKMASNVTATNFIKTSREEEENKQRMGRE